MHEASFILSVTSTVKTFGSNVSHDQRSQTWPLLQSLRSGRLLALRRWLTNETHAAEERTDVKGNTCPLIPMQTHGVSERAPMPNVHVSEGNNWRDRLVEGARPRPPGTRIPEPAKT